MTMTNTAYNFSHTKLGLFNNCQPFNASLIHVVSKIPGHKHERVSQIKTKNVHIKHISGNEWHLSLDERLQSTLSTLTMQYFAHKWRCTFTLHVASLEFLLFMNLEITTNAESDLHLHQGTKGHVRSRSVAIFPRCRYFWEWPDRHQKVRWWSVCSLSIGAECSTGFKSFHS